MTVARRLLAGRPKHSSNRNPPVKRCPAGVAQSCETLLRSYVVAGGDPTPEQSDSVRSGPSRVSGASYIVRRLRWPVVLSAERQIVPQTVFWAMMAGYLGNSILPARSGELMRSVLLGRRVRLSTSYLLATALLERLANAIAPVTISLLALLALGALPDWLLIAAQIMGLLGLVGGQLSSSVRACFKLHVASLSENGGVGAAVQIPRLNRPNETANR
jgi:hypothetical protein